MQRFAPVVDRFEVVVKKLNGKAADTDAPGPDTPAVETPKDKYQYQRAYRLSVDLRDYMYGYTSEQIKQIQEHNVLVYVNLSDCGHNVFTDSPLIVNALPLPLKTSPLPYQLLTVPHQLGFILFRLHMRVIVHDHGWK